MVIEWAEQEGTEGIGWARTMHQLKGDSIVVFKWYPTPVCILSTSSVTGIECIERYGWLEWALGIGGFWVSEEGRRE